MISGIINVNKPSGVTSFDVVKNIRKKLGGRIKVGHAGTLDPGATGVLLILVGEATKVSGFLMRREKEYETKMVLGVTTDTHDGEGKELSRGECCVTRKGVEEAFSSFTGLQKQVPPMLSAKKYQGERLYKLFRRGETVGRKPEDIEIKSLAMLSFNLPGVEFRVVCSKGTYIRTLCHDIGSRLGCGAYMSSLVRTRVGRFGLEDSVTCSEDTDYREHIIPLSNVMSNYPHLLVNSETASGIRNGKQISESEVINIEIIREQYQRGVTTGVFPVFDQKDTLLAMVNAGERKIESKGMMFKLLRVIA